MIRFDRIQVSIVGIGAFLIWGCSSNGVGGAGSASSNTTTASPISASTCAEFAEPDELPAAITSGIPLTKTQIAGFSADGSADTYSVLLRTKSENAPSQWSATKANRFVDCTRFGTFGSGLTTEKFVQSAGYVPWGSTNNSHLISAKCVLDGLALNPICPESVIVSSDEIVGAMFITSMEFAQSVNPAGPQGVWHVHRSKEKFCLGAALTFLQKATNGTCAVGAPVTESPPMMHVNFSGPTFDSIPDDSDSESPLKTGSDAHDHDMEMPVIE